MTAARAISRSTFGIPVFPCSSREVLIDRRFDLGDRLSAICYRLSSLCQT
jgi:hypothetical protein